MEGGLDTSPIDEASSARGEGSHAAGEAPEAAGEASEARGEAPDAQGEAPHAQGKASAGAPHKHRGRRGSEASRVVGETFGVGHTQTGEKFWPAQLAVLVAIVLSATLPDKLTLGPAWLLPALESVFLLALAITTPMRVHPEHSRRRHAAILMIALINATNLISLVLLAHYLLHGGKANGRELITSGAEIWLTNVIVFALWYWESDCGGPAARTAGVVDDPDFLFPQMTDERLGRNWCPKFIDYLYVSLTNAAAFSPTDTMPLTALAKSLMGIQSLISLVTIGLVVSRAVNILQ